MWLLTEGVSKPVAERNAWRGGTGGVILNGTREQRSCIGYHVSILAGNLPGTSQSNELDDDIEFGEMIAAAVSTYLALMPLPLTISSPNMC